MTNNIIQRYANIPLIAVFLVMVASVSAIVSLSTSSPSAALPYSPKNILSVRDDHCYSELSRLTSMGGPFGTPNFGLVNAIVNLPVYDWDQSGPGLESPYTQYKVMGSNSLTRDAGLRGSLQGKSVGYADRFDFNVTPVPNLNWMTKYFRDQAAYDVGTLVSFAGIPNPVAQPNPHIANPFIYTQSAIIAPSGIPKIQAVRNSLLNTGAVPDAGPEGSINDGLLTPGEDGSTPSIGDVNYDELGIDNINVGNVGEDGIRDAIDARNNSLRDNSGLIQQLLTNRGGIIGGINAAQSDVTRNVDSLVGNLLSIEPIKGLGSSPYQVNGADMRDRCYETIASNNHVPAYAFSVPRVGIPVTLPGWIYSIVTIPSGYGFSSSGMTIYTGGSANSKDMLDCYGRGVQPIVTPDPNLKVSQFVAVGFRHGFVVGAINFGIRAALLAANLEPLANTLPAFIPHREDYTSGFTFLFRLNDMIQSQLPAHLSNRAINLSASKESDVNWKYLLGGNGHNESQNGQQFNPDLYIKLHKPYVVDAEFDIGNEPQRTPDGTEVPVVIKASKHGFNDRNTADGGYTEDKSKGGGPTYDPNPPDRTGRAFTEARVYKMVMKPGTVVNAIDARKVLDGTKQYYRSDTSPTQINGSTDPCSFFAGQLVSGDPGAKPSRLTEGGDTNANQGLPEGARPTIENRPLGDDADFTCGQVAGGGLKIDEDRDTQTIYNQNEKISAETPPGTKVCFAVYYTNYTNDVKTQGNHWWDGSQSNWNPNHNTPDDKTQLSRAHCIIAGHKPSLQVRGGDMLVDGRVDTGTNDKEYLASESDPKEIRTYGSWAEYGVIASGRINRIGSGGLHRTGMPAGWDDIGYLTFSNNRTPGGGTSAKQYGEYASSLNDGFNRVARQFTAMNSSEVTQLTSGNTINVNDLKGVYRVPENGNIVLANDRGPDQGYAIDPEKPIIILAGPNATVTIRDNIKIPNQYDSISQMSQLVIAPAVENGAYRINLADTVSNLDAWLINPAGTINTCYTGAAGSSVANVPRANTPCHQNNLEINGPVSAKHLLLRRTGGSDQSAGGEVRQSVPAENFNLRPDAYIWAAEYVNSGGTKYITTHAKDLPPRY